jgi:hypothetical protein
MKQASLCSSIVHCGGKRRALKSILQQGPTLNCLTPKALSNRIFISFDHGIEKG